MSATVNKVEAVNQPKVIRDKAFARRLEQACDQNPNCPSDRGKQKWLYDALASRFGVKVSPEAARKWFAGESRPRPKIMNQIAKILDVDEAWLSLGISPVESPIEKKMRNAVAEGAVNYVAGLIQMAGGTIAFPEKSNGHEPDLFAIINGRKHQIEIKTARQENSHFEVRVALESVENIILVVIDTGKPVQFDVVALPPEVLNEHGKSRGGYIEIDFEKVASGYKAGNMKLPKIIEFNKLEAAQRAA